MKYVRKSRSKDASGWLLGPSGSRILLMAAHLPAKMGGVRDTDQQTWAQWLADDLVEMEENEKTRATMLVGDLNMNPYDPAVVSAAGLHALMTREQASKQDRRHRGMVLRRFYNPMWALFGDRTEGPAGSYYWDSSVPSNPGWHILDQVLLRPEVMNLLLDLRIVGHDGVESLLEKGIP